MKNLSLLFLLAPIVSAQALVKETIATGLRDPMEVAIAPDGHFFVTEREGRLLRINPETGGVFEIGKIEVHALRASHRDSSYGREDGLQGIAVDPDFANNQRIYIYYSHPEKLINRLSRFTLKDGALDHGSEVPILEVPIDREERVCHHGGSVEFGPDGLLYLSTGDNTNPFRSDGYSPLDNREGRGWADAQRTAGNTNDLRGKILRIKLTEDGYEIPEGNLFAPGTEKTRPEIYVMGCRNPFRISLDPKTKTLYWGEVGPDAAEPSEFGPKGHDEVNQAKAPGNYGWPFVIADNQPYPIRDFKKKAVVEMTDPAAPKNPSQRNTGLSILPPAQPAMIWYPYKKSEEFPVMGEGGRNAMAGPVFYHDSSRTYNILNKEDDHSLLTYEWMRGKIYKAKLDQDEKLEKLEVLIDGLSHPMDLEMKKDGSLVLLEYGSDWWFNTTGGVYRFRPEDGNKPPTITIKPTEGVEGGFSVDQATDPENEKITVNWYLTEGASERDLGSGSTGVVPDGVFQELRAVAQDPKGAIAVARAPLSGAATTQPLNLEIVGDPKQLAFGDTLQFKVGAGKAPDPAQLIVRARYIPPTGHDAGGPQLSEDIAELVKSNQCFACHQLTVTSVGPHYLNVSLKYRDREDAAAYLKEKLKTGGAGVWGEVPMPPQIALKEVDSEKIIRAILSLSDGISETTGTLEGTLKLSPPYGNHTGGAWEISAEAPGYAPKKIRVSAK